MVAGVTGGVAGIHYHRIRDTTIAVIHLHQQTARHHNKVGADQATIARAVRQTSFRKVNLEGDQAGHGRDRVIL
jgi:hypothetical protein